MQAHQGFQKTTFELNETLMISYNNIAELIFAGKAGNNTTGDGQLNIISAQ